MFFLHIALFESWFCTNWGFLISPPEIMSIGDGPYCTQRMYRQHSQRKYYINTLRPKQNGRHFADDIFKRIFLNENIWIPIKISVMFVPKGSINNIPALVQIMAWRRPGDKPLSEPKMVNLPTHICVTRSQWVNYKVKLFYQLQSNNTKHFSSTYIHT